LLKLFSGLGTIRKGKEYEDNSFLESHTNFFLRIVRNMICVIMLANGLSYLPKVYFAMAKIESLLLKLHLKGFFRKTSFTKVNRTLFYAII